MSEITAPPVETYYDILALRPKATAKEVEVAFRRLVARYRSTTTVQQLTNDPRFMKYLNAYLTLGSTLRAEHDALISRPPVKDQKITLPSPWADYDERRRALLLGKIALWRREHVEGIHSLRTLLDRAPDFAEGWALLGEFFLTINRLQEGVQCYERALAADPELAPAAARLAHARAALAGEVELEIEVSPEEEMLIEERRQRRSVTFALLALAIVTLAASFFVRSHPFPGAFYVPWWTVATQSLGIFVLFLGLAFGRMIDPFEHVMLWSGLAAGDRGRIRNYPYALILLVMTVPSLWLAFICLLIIALMDDEWPVSPTLLLGICALVTLLLAFKMYLITGHAHWSGTLIIGGNALVLSGMLGWWFGSLGTTSYS